MPSRTDHIQKAEHNQRFWGSLDLDSTPFLDWVATGIFYEAVHWMEACLADFGRHSKSHYSRNETIKLNPVMNTHSHLAPDYDVLRVDSENARYWLHSHTPDEIRDLVEIIDRVRTTAKVILGI